MKEYGDRHSVAGKPISVGIDQSYTGFSITLLNEGGYYTTVYSGLGKGVNRLIDLADHLQDSLDGAYGDLNCKIGTVAMEGYAPGAKYGREMAGELGGQVKVLLAEWGIRPLIVTPSQLKKYATGKGVAKKQQIMLEVYKHWGVSFDDDNAADSYVLARMAAGLSEFKYQEEVLSSVHTEAQ